MNENVRIMVISVSSWNTETGMNTWPALLEGHPSEKVAHVCFREDPPDHPVCDRYFVFSENRVLKSIFHRHIRTGVVTHRVTDLPELARDRSVRGARYGKLSRHRNAFTLLARELVWKLGKWKTPELTSFIRDFHPDVLLYSMEGMLHVNRVCEYAKKLTGAPSVGFFTDDHFTRHAPLKLLPLRMFQRASLKKLARDTDAFFAITEKTKREADAFFGINCTVLTKPLTDATEPKTSAPSFPLEILYTGSLGIGRDKTLLRLADAVQNVNGKEPKFRITVYTGTALPKKIRSALPPDVVTLYGAIPQTEALQKQQTADILLFLEALDGADAQTARLSFSTKITDYLSAGKCILALGDSSTAPMEYFQTNRCAIIATNDKEIRNALIRIAERPDLLSVYADAARDCGRRNHGKQQILTRFRQTVEGVLRDKDPDAISHLK